jgi:hypothetical protein
MTLSPLIPAQAGTRAFSTRENTENTDALHGVRPRRYNSPFHAFRVFRGPIRRLRGNGITNKNAWVPACAGMSGSRGVPAPRSAGG